MCLDLALQSSNMYSLCANVELTHILAMMLPPQPSQSQVSENVLFFQDIKYYRDESIYSSIFGRAGGACGLGRCKRGEGGGMGARGRHPGILCQRNPVATCPRFRHAKQTFINQILS